MKLNILGTEYTVEKRKYNDDPTFSENSFDGYCDEWAKLIVCCDMSTYKGWDKEPPESIERCEKTTLRHEIVHAFLNESGLSFCSSQVDGPWAKHEEMVDWLALQGPKIYAAWEQAGAL